jgi:transposase
MEPLPESAPPSWPFPFLPQDWEHTPAAVPAYVHTLQNDLTQLRERVEALEARLTQNATTSHRPPSSDSPYKKPRQRPATPQKAGGKPGHPGHRQALVPPTAVQALPPERCPCGTTTFALTRPYHTHQVLELPPLTMEVTHWVLHQGWCPACGRWSKAQVPAEHATGSGPRLRALRGELAGAYGNGRRIVQTFCASVLQVPISVRDHRVATCGRLRAWRLASLAPRAFSSSAGLTSLVYHSPQADPGVCRLETSWNRSLSLRTPSGRFPLPPRTGTRPRLPCKPLCAPCAMHWGSSKRVSKPWTPGSSRIPRPPPGRRRRTRLTSSLASVRPPPRPGRRGANRAIRAIARGSCHPRRSRRGGLSGVRVAPRRWP